MKFELQRFNDMTISGGGTYNIDSSYSNSTITVNTTDAVTLKGDNAELNSVYIVISATTGNLTVENLNITNQNGAVITFGDGADNQLNVAGTNIFEIVTGNSAAVNVGGGLTVNGTGSLKATTLSGACIGVNGSQNLSSSNITIESGTFDLTARSGSCAIGGAGAVGNAIGDITITGTANITANTPNGYGAAIGSCYRGSVGNILINGDAIVNATTGQHAAAIGGAPYTQNGTITITGNATVNADNISTVDDSAAIGSGLGAQVQTIGDIVISGNANVTATSNLGLAIDNIEWIRESSDFTKPDSNEHSVANDDATITITDNAIFNGKSGDIFTATTINDEEITAATINYSNGTLTYEGGAVVDDTAINSTLLNITGGGTYNLDADSVGKIFIETTDAVTINGNGASISNVQIISNTDNANLTIQNLNITNKDTSAIRFGSGANNKLTIVGSNSFNISKSNKSAVNIGGGVEIGGDGSLKVVTMNGSCIGTDGEENLSNSNIVINGGTFDLRARSGASAIGGAGNGSKIGDITITGTANVTANTPQGYAAAIGSSYRGTVGNITVNGDATITASAGQHAAAIGSSTFCDNGNITIGGKAYIVAGTTSTDYHSAAIGADTDDQAKSLGNIVIGENATVHTGSASGLAINNILYTETTYSNVPNTNIISINQNDGDNAYVTAHNGSSVAAPATDIVTINGTAISGDTELLFYSGNDNFTLPPYQQVANAGNVFVNNTGNNVYIATGVNNDTINSTGENVTINTGGGEDTIIGYDEDDVILLNESLVSAGVDGSKVVLVTDNDTLTVIDAASKVLNISYGDSINQIMYGSRWSTVEGGFVYSDISKNVDVTITGADLTDDSLNVEIVQANPYITSAIITGLSGEVSVNGVDVGISGDDDYEVHLTVKVADNAPDKVKQNANNLNSYFGISDGASLKLENGNVVTFDKTGNYHIGDGGTFYLQSEKYAHSGSDEKTRLAFDNGGNGINLAVEDDVFTEISGLNDGFKVTVKAGYNVEDTLNFKVDGRGTITSGDTSMVVNGDNDFVVVFGENGIESLEEFSGTSSKLYTGDNDVNIDDDSPERIIAKSKNEILNASGRNNDAQITGNSKNNTIIGGSGKNTLNGGKGNDSLVGGDSNNKLLGGVGNDTLISGAGNDTLIGGNGNDVFIYNGGNDLITDYQSGQDKIMLDNVVVSGSALNGKNIEITTDKGILTVKNVKGKNITVIDAEGNETTNIYPTIPANLNYNAKMTALTANDNFDGDEIDLSKYASTVKEVDVSNISVDVNITGNSNNNVIRAGAGNDTISGGRGNNTLIGGSGSDTFVYVKGNAVITDYAVEDTIVLSSSKITDSAVKDNNIVLNTADGKITVQNARYKEITIIDAEGNTAYYGTTQTLTDNDKRDFISTNNILKIDATARTTASRLFGNANDNTITGGRGNDTLYGGKGKDTFVYTGGDDLITDYKAGEDTIIFADKINAISAQGSKVQFVTDNGTLTVSNAKNKNITIIDSNGDTSTEKYTSNYINNWIVEDDNLYSNDNEFSAIMQGNIENYLSANIQNQNYSSLNQDTLLPIATNK